jgi:RNA polymerase sigma factor (sigma-70 family)
MVQLDRIHQMRYTDPSSIITLMENNSFSLKAHQRTEEVFLKYRQRVFRCIFRSVGHVQTAEDLTQEVFLYLAQHMVTLLRSQRSVELWLAACMHRSIDKWYANRRVQPEIFISEIDCQAYQIIDLIPWVALREDVNRALDGLKPAMRTVLLLSHIHGFSFEEIGNLMSHEPGETRKLFWSSRQSLQSRLAHLLDSSPCR